MEGKSSRKVSRPRKPQRPGRCTLKKSSSGAFEVAIDNEGMPEATSEFTSVGVSKASLLKSSRSGAFEVAIDNGGMPQGVSEYASVGVSKASLQKSSRSGAYQVAIDNERMAEPTSELAGVGVSKASPFGVAGVSKGAARAQSVPKAKKRSRSNSVSAGKKVYGLLSNHLVRLFFLKAEISNVT